jgi:hypothetical protein
MISSGDIELVPEGCAAMCIPRQILGVEMLKFVASEAGYQGFRSKGDSFQSWAFLSAVPIYLYSPWISY